MEPGEREGDNGTNTVAARTAPAGRRARRGREPRGPGRGAASPPRGAGVLTQGLLRANRRRRPARRLPRRARAGALARHARGRDRAADRHRRRRHRRPDRGAHAAGRQGFASTVYEAYASRVGGRMYSDFVEFPGYWADGQGSEWCGELIDTGHKTIRASPSASAWPTVDLLGAEPNGSRTRTTSSATTTRRTQADQRLPGRCTRRCSATSRPPSYPTHLQLVDTPAGVALDHMSVYDWIESRVPGGHGSPFGQLLDVAYDIEYGAETTDQSALNLVYLLGYQPSPATSCIFGESDERFHVRGGNQLLPLAIARRDRSRAGRRRPAWPASALDRANADGTVDAHASTRRRKPSGDRRPRRPGAAVRRPAHARLLAAPASTRSRRRRSRSSAPARNGKLQLQFTSRLWNGPARGGHRNGAQLLGHRLPDTLGRDARPGRARRASSSTTPAGTSRRSLRAVGAVRDRGERAGGRRTRRRFLGQFEPVFPGISARWNGKATLSRPCSIRTCTARTRTGGRAVPRASAATRGCGRATSTSPASTARRTSRATWRAAPPRASAQPREILADLK